MSKRSLIIILVVISLLPLWDLLQRGLPITHDGPDHVARIANFYQSFSEGNLVPRWGANLNWGYGHPVLMFLYPLPSYLASFFHFFGFSFVDSTKLVFATAFSASLIAMYLWASAQFGLMPGFVTAVLYGFAPYRFVDLYVRGAIGEHVAFIFPPLILYGLLKLTKDRRSSLWGIVTSLSTAGLILSHNAASLMFMPIIIFYLIYLFFFEAKRKVTYLAKTALYLFEGFILSAFFWIPAFFEGKYTLRDIVTKGDFTDRFVPLAWFISSPWNYGGGNDFTKALGFAQLGAILGGLIVLWKGKNSKLKLLATAGLLVVLGSIFLMTGWSELIWAKITLLQKFQFPWRLLALAVFSGAFLGGATVSAFSGRIGRLVTVILTITALLTTVSMWHAKTYSLKSEEYYSGIYNGTTDTGESSPIWSVRFMETRAKAPLEVISGEASLVTMFRSTTEHDYQVNVKAKSRLLENTLYFPGWKVLVDGKEVPIEFQDPNYRGLMTFDVYSGKHAIRVIFERTKLRTMAELTTIVGLVIIIVAAIPLYKLR